jgi:thioredoxin reductase (NADPH)
MNDEKREMKNELYDTVIIGGGPAGLTAGMYAARGRMKALLVESFSVMGQATMTEMIENYPGIEKASGFDIVDSFKKQAVKFGLTCESGTASGIAGIKSSGFNAWRVETDNGSFDALSVIVASGAHAQKVGVPGESELTGKGVSYCATCDGPLFRNKEVVVIGGGNTAIEESLFLAKFASKVTVVHRRDRLRASKIVQERAFAEKKINFVWEAVPENIKGAEKVEGISINSIKTGERSEIACSGVFVFIGWRPNTDFLAGTVDLDEHASIKVDAAMRTSAPGIFACGDCTSKVFHQVVTACGDGATAAFTAEHYVDELKGVAYK